MCNICDSFEPYDFHTPGLYMKCLNNLQQLIESKKFKLIKKTCPVDKVKKADGCWIDDIIVHVIKCKKCGEKFECSVNTYCGGGGIRKI